MILESLVRRSLVDAFYETFAGMIVDLETAEILSVTQPCEEMFGYHVRNLLVGQNIEILVPEELRAAHRKGIEGYRQHPTIRYMGERKGLRGLRRDGTTFRITVGLRPVRLTDVDRTVVVVLFFSLDEPSGFTPPMGIPAL